jgi:Cu-processing system ATP-binding protein
MIRIEKLSKKFRKQFALREVSAEFGNNEVIALIGPNGSGKTTLIKCILGMVYPDDGDIFFRNHPIRSGNSYRNEIGYMPQTGSYPDNMSIVQLVRMMTDIRNANPAAIDNELYQSFELEKIAGKTMRSLSGGTRQKVSACLAFMFKPSVLILDEPTAGLDPVSSEILKKKILKEKANGKTVIVTSHVLNDLDDLATHVLYLQDGSVKLFSTVDEITSITGEHRLNRSIAMLMQSNFNAGNILNKQDNAVSSI